MNRIYRFSIATLVLGACLSITSIFGFHLYLGDLNAAWHVAELKPLRRLKFSYDGDLSELSERMPSEQSREKLYRTLNSARHPEEQPLLDRATKPQLNDTLPPQVLAPEGRLTLFADYSDRRGDFVVIYLVNRLNYEISLPTQDRDLRIKLHGKLADSSWQLAEGHLPSWCGNSYYPITLASGHHYRILGYSPNEGTPCIVRYQFFGTEMPAVFSNEGEGRILDADVQAAKLWR